MVKMHSDDDRYDNGDLLHGYAHGDNSRYPNHSSAVPSLHPFPLADPVRWDSVTLLEASRDDTNAWAKKFAELNRQVRMQSYLFIYV